MTKTLPMIPPSLGVIIPLAFFPLLREGILSSLPPLNYVNLAIEAITRQARSPLPSFFFPLWFSPPLSITQPFSPTSAEKGD